MGQISGGPADSSGGPADFSGGPADCPGGPADFPGGPADFPGGPAALNSLENSTQTRPHTPAPHTLEITKNVWDVRHVWVLSAFTSITPHQKLRIPPAHPKTLQDPNILRTFATAIASAADGNRPHQSRTITGHKLIAYLYIHWRAMYPLCCRVAPPSAPTADTCAQHLHIKLTKNSQWNPSGRVPL